MQQLQKYATVSRSIEEMQTLTKNYILQKFQQVFDRRSIVH